MFQKVQLYLSIFFFCRNQLISGYQNSRYGQINPTRGNADPLQSWSDYNYHQVNGATINENRAASSVFTILNHEKQLETGSNNNVGIILQADLRFYIPGLICCSYSYY